MSSEFCMERSHKAVTQEEWSGAVSTINSLRLSPRKIRQKDKNTEKWREVTLKDVDAAMCFEDEWIPVFSFRDARIEFTDGNFPELVFPVALKLSKELKVDIRLVGGDDTVFRKIEDFWNAMGIPEKHWPDASGNHRQGKSTAKSGCLGVVLAIALFLPGLWSLKVLFG